MEVGIFCIKKASHHNYPFDLSSMCLRGLERCLTTGLYVVIQ